MLGKYDGKKLFRIPRRRCEDNIKMCPEGIAW
jgi:hypothetical protein